MTNPQCGERTQSRQHPQARCPPALPTRGMPRPAISPRTPPQRCRQATVHHAPGLAVLVSPAPVATGGLAHPTTRPLALCLAPGSHQLVLDLDDEPHRDKCGVSPGIWHHAGVGSPVPVTQKKICKPPEAPARRKQTRHVTSYRNFPSTCTCTCMRYEM